MRGFVYTARDVAGNVLYVGTTRDVNARMVAHRRTSRWWAFHATLEVEEFATLDEASAAENDGICRHDPPYNVRGGHAAHGGLCSGRRCRRLQGECERREAWRSRRAVRGRRCGLPLQEWDQACGRTRAFAPQPSLTIGEVPIEEPVEGLVGNPSEETTEAETAEPGMAGREIAEPGKVDGGSTGVVTRRQQARECMRAASTARGSERGGWPPWPAVRAPTRTATRHRRRPVLATRVPDLRWPP